MNNDAKIAAREEARRAVEATWEAYDIACWNLHAAQEAELEAREAADRANQALRELEATS